MKTADLSGDYLDFWVLRCEGRGDDVAFDPSKKYLDLTDFKPFCPSVKWAHGGPIIEREKIDLEWVTEYSCEALYACDGLHMGKGATPLLAAMRAYVTCKFGDVVPDA